MNGGVSDTATIRNQGLELSPVFKNNAQSFYKYGDGQWTNFLSFIPQNDSARWSIGLMSFHRFQIFQRIYTEQDSLAGLYSVINYDSLETSRSIQRKQR